jgi:hypothetical protein
MECPLPPTEYMRLVCGDKPDLREHFDIVGRQIARALKSMKCSNRGHDCST